MVRQNFLLQTETTVAFSTISNGANQEIVQEKHGKSSAPPRYATRLDNLTGLIQEEIDLGIRIDTTDDMPRHRTENMTFVNSKYRSQSQENRQTWANKTSINISPKKPPIIDFEALNEQRKAA